MRQIALVQGLVVFPEEEGLYSEREERVKGSGGEGKVS